MKNFNIVLMFNLLLSGATSLADVKDLLISERRIQLPVEISESTVILSSAGYTAPLVKILIPAIASVTIMNHRNLTANAPCLSTPDTLNPGDVIKNDPHLTQQIITIRLLKNATLDTSSANPTCNVTLTETLDSDIRGFHFTHQRTATMPARSPEDCR